MPGWSAPQVHNFARQFAQSPQGQSWWAFVPSVREALIAECVLGIVLGQDREQVSVEAIEQLRDDLRRALAEHHRMATYRGDAGDVHARPDASMFATSDKGD